MPNLLLLILCACLVAGRNIHLPSRPALDALAAALAATALAQASPSLATMLAAGAGAARTASGAALPLLWQAEQGLRSLPALASLASGALMVEAMRRLRGERSMLVAIAALMGFAAVLSSTVLTARALDTITATLTAGAFAIAALLALRLQLDDANRVGGLLALTLAAMAMLSLVHALQYSLSATGLSDFATATEPGAPLWLVSDWLMLIGIGLTAPLGLALALRRQGEDARRDRSIDRVTGALSRSFLLAGAEPWIAEQQREHVSTALIMVKVDQYRNTVIRHGSAVGDEVLRHLVTLLQNALLNDSIIARYEGEQFCVLAPVRDEQDARRVAERMRRIVEKSPYADGERSIPLTISLGLAMHRAGHPLSDAFSIADRRLYQARSAGDNRVIAEESLLDSAVV